MAGPVSGAANVISGNSSVGVEIYGSGSTSNLIEGNIIGLAADGRSAFRGSNGLFVQSVGVFIQAASDNLIGGSVAGAGNVISGNESAGVFILSSAGTSQGNSVQGNFIGLGENGGPGPGNDGYGILLDNAPSNPIGRKGSAANRFGRNGIADIRKYSGPQTASLAQVALSASNSHATAHPQGPARHVRRKLSAVRAKRLERQARDNARPHLSSASVADHGRNLLSPASPRPAEEVVEIKHRLEVERLGRADGRHNART